MDKDTTTQAAPSQPAESVYPAAELVKAAKQAFGVEPYILVALCKVHQIEQATRSEIDALLQAFLATEA